MNAGPERLADDRPPTEAAMVALSTVAGLPAITPWRLRRLMWHHPPTEVLELLRSGAELHPMVHRALGPATLRTLRDEARAARPGEVLERCRRTGVDIVPLTDLRYPPALRFDRQAPVVLFVRGDLGVLDARRVAVIGTRNATASGRATAAELGAELARGGVTVLSGLARGIDGAAHRGVRSVDGRRGSPAAVVANGLDRPYPRQHTDLWRWVGDAGLLVSEWAPGFAPEAWRFPLRNRILAALAEVVVVVESRERGGSLITVDEAAKRGVPVMVVPGSVRSRASEGTNTLIAEGATTVTSAADVFVKLGLEHSRQGRLAFDPRPIPNEFQQRVLDLCTAAARTPDMLVAELGAPVIDVAMALARLEHTGWVVETAGWFELAGSRLVAS